MRICVFCGSSRTSTQRYTDVAASLGRLLVRRRIGVVYGGASVGTPGALADAVLAAGGEVIGVIPRAMMAPEVAHSRLTQQHVVEGMHERKALMSALSDAFLALPGGAGTFDELFEAWTWRNVGLHDKPIGVLDADGFYAPLLAQIERMSDDGFLPDEDRARLLVDDDLGRIVDRLCEPLG
ncbi:MAG: TIGR00730 family Rossman fold protein [Actinomycetota bacterium]